jgi:ABC-type transport system involved in cytochrome bd biosynthesis fused ATPase/permease subunit
VIGDNPLEIWACKLLRRKHFHGVSSASPHAYSLKSRYGKASFYQSPIHSTALGKAEFTVDAKKGLSIVFGDTGYGKSTLARLLHGKFKEKDYILFC